MNVGTILVYGAYVVTSGLLTAMVVLDDMRRPRPGGHDLVRSVVASPLPWYVVSGLVIAFTGADLAVMLLAICSLINVVLVVAGAIRLRRMKIRLIGKP